MGNDGGSIARRDELVKVKTSTISAKGKAKSSQKLRWTTCTLSKEPLREPVVGDALGRLYNKEAITEWLVQRAVQKHQGKEVKESAAFSHIKTSKDLTTLKLTPNPSFKADSTQTDTSDEPLTSTQTPFICPLTSRLMNGSQRFVFIRTPDSGAVLSESALKAIVPSNSAQEVTATCPVTETPFHPGSLASKKGLAASDPDNVGDVVLVNPLPGSPEEEVLVLADALRRKNAKTKKKEKRNGSEHNNGDERKADTANGHTDKRKRDNGAEADDQVDKKVKH